MKLSTSSIIFFGHIYYNGNENTVIFDTWAAGGKTHDPKEALHQLAALLIIFAITTQMLLRSMVSLGVQCLQFKKGKQAYQTFYQLVEQRYCRSLVLYVVNDS